MTSEQIMINQAHRLPDEPEFGPAALPAEQLPAEQPAVTGHEQRPVSEQDQQLQAVDIFMQDMSGAIASLEQGAEAGYQIAEEALALRNRHNRDSQELRLLNQNRIEIQQRNQTSFDRYEAAIADSVEVIEHMLKDDDAIAGAAADLNAMERVNLQELQSLSRAMWAEKDIQGAAKREVAILGPGLLEADRTLRSAEYNHRIALRKLQAAELRHRQAIAQKGASQAQTFEDDFVRGTSQGDIQALNRAYEYLEQHPASPADVLAHEKPKADEVKISQTEEEKARAALDQARAVHADRDGRSTAARERWFTSYNKFQDLFLQARGTMTRYEDVKALEQHRLQPLRSLLQEDLRGLQLLDHRLKSEFERTIQASGRVESTAEELDLDTHFTLSLPPLEERARELAEIRDHIAAMQEDHDLTEREPADLEAVAGSSYQESAVPELVLVVDDVRVHEMSSEG